MSHENKNQATPNQKPIEKYLKQHEAYFEKLGSPTSIGMKAKLKRDVSKQPKIFSKLVIELHDQFHGVYLSGEDAFLIPNEKETGTCPKIERRFILLTDLVDGHTPRLLFNEETKDCLFRIMRKILPEDLKAIDVIPSKKLQGKFEVFDGNLRKYCAVILEWSGLWSDIHLSMTEAEAHKQSFNLNYKKNDITELELGHWFKHEMETFPDIYPSPRAIAAEYNFSEPYVRQLIKLFKSAPPDQITPLILKELAQKRSFLDADKILRILGSEIINKTDRRDLFFILRKLRSNDLKVVATELELQKPSVYYYLDERKKGAPSLLTAAKILTILMKEEKCSLKKYDSTTINRLEEINKNMKQNVENLLNPQDDMMRQLVSTEEALRNLQVETEKDLKAEEAKVVKLGKFYPAEMIAALNEKIASGISPEVALQEVKAERVSLEEDLKNTSGSEDPQYQAKNQR